MPYSPPPTTHLSVLCEVSPDREMGLSLDWPWPYLFSSGIDRRTFAGFPTTTVFAGTSLVTTLPAPTMAFSPMVTLLRIVEPDPMDAPFRTKVLSTFQSASVCNSPVGVVERG